MTEKCLGVNLEG